MLPVIEYILHPKRAIPRPQLPLAHRSTGGAQTRPASLVSSGRRAARSTRNHVAAVGIAAAAMLGGGAKEARAGTVYVDASWVVGGSPILVNNILDGDPLTFGKDGRTDLVPGDTLHFSAGVYQLGLGQGCFQVHVEDVIIEGDGVDANGEPTTKFAGANPGGSIPVWAVYANNCVLQDFETGNSFAGVCLLSPDHQNIVLQRIRAVGHGTHMFYVKREAPEETLQPSIHIEFCEFIGSHSGTGISISSLDGTPKTKYAGVSNCTLDGIEIGINAPFYSVGPYRLAIKGSNDLHNNVCLNGASTYAPDLYQFFETPDGHVEANVENGLVDNGVQPETGTPNIEYPSVADLQLDANGNPTAGSPLIGPQYGPAGYCGARPPNIPGDLNCDGHVDFDDINPFVAALVGRAGYESLQPSCRWYNGDCSGDGSVDFDDINSFVSCLVSGGCP